MIFFILFVLFCSSFPPLLLISKYVLRHSPLYNIVIHFYKLVTSIPEEGWFGQPKYVSLAVVFDFSPFFIFQVWLIRSLLRSNVQSSRIFVHGFAVYLVYTVKPVKFSVQQEVRPYRNKLHVSSGLIKGWSSQLIFQFKQLERRSLKKTGLQRDSSP